jgi:hypothetical protein
MSKNEAPVRKVPMPSSGEYSLNFRWDGVSHVNTHGRMAGPEFGGGAYGNPHTGKEARGEGSGVGGGQSEQDYHNPEPLDGGGMLEAGAAPMGKGGGGSG